MPQLDKLSFATQYFWLTLFFFGLYFLTLNFFVIAVFKNLRLRNTIYKIWYYFLYKFDYNDYYNNKSARITALCFNAIYYNLYTTFYIFLKANSVYTRLSSLINKAYAQNLIKGSISSTKAITLVSPLLINEQLIQDLNKIQIDEI